MQDIIANAANTLVPALLALRQKGFTVCQKPTEGMDAWVAIRDSRSFVADAPVSLLGLVAMVEIRGDNWMASDEEIDRYLTEFKL